MNAQGLFAICHKYQVKKMNQHGGLNNFIDTSPPEGAVQSCSCAIHCSVNTLPRGRAPARHRRARPRSLTKMVSQQQQNMPASTRRREESSCPRTNGRTDDDDEGDGDAGSSSKAGSAARNLPTAKERGNEGERGAAATALLFVRSFDDVLVFTFALAAAAAASALARWLAGSADRSRRSRSRRRQRRRNKSERNQKGETEKRQKTTSRGDQEGREHCQQRRLGKFYAIYRRRRNSDKREFSNPIERRTPPVLNATATTENTSSSSPTELLLLNARKSVLHGSAEPKQEG